MASKTEMAGLYGDRAWRVAQSEENGGAVAPPVDCPVNRSYSSGSSLFFGVVLAFRLFFDLSIRFDRAEQAQKQRDLTHVNDSP